MLWLVLLRAERDLSFSQPLLWALRYVTLRRDARTAVIIVSLSALSEQSCHDERRAHVHGKQVLHILGLKNVEVGFPAEW